MKYDMHVHLWLGREKQNMDELKKACELYEVDKIFVSGLAGELPELDRINEVNDAVLEFKRDCPNLVEGYVHVNPRHKGCMDTLRRCVEDGGMIGMKLWIATLCDDPLNAPYIEKCIEYDIPILVHAWHKTTGQMQYESTSEHVARTALRYPQAKFIMAHIAGNCYYGVKPVADLPNVYIDFCGSVFRADDLPYTVEWIGADRILYGTDMPGSYWVNEGQVLEADLTDEQKQMIMYKNTAKLFYKEEPA